MALAKDETQKELQEALAVVDAKALFDVMSRDTHGGRDRRNAIDVQLLKEEIRALKGHIRWVESKDMLADCLTKKNVTWSLSWRF